MRISSASKKKPVRASTSSGELVNYKQRASYDHHNQNAVQGGQTGMTDPDERFFDQYDMLRDACLELYLSVKIRADDEIDNFTENKLQQEKN